MNDKNKLSDSAVFKLVNLTYYILATEQHLNKFFKVVFDTLLPLKIFYLYLIFCVNYVLYTRADALKYSTSTILNPR